MMPDREANLFRSMTQSTKTFYIWIGFLSTVALWGLYAYIVQLRSGLIVTGMRDQIFWGLYITNFVFFIGISHAGTLISAILRVTDAGWRRPVTRLAEGITVVALCIGAPMVIIDLGRPDRMFNLFIHPRIQSPILWDVLSVGTYLTGCLLYLYIPMIPDLAILAGRPDVGPLRRRFYKVLSIGWKDTPAQWRVLERSISVMAIAIIPLAISVHTVVSWIFSMTLRPGWNSSIFGPYFVVGAIYSGAAAVVFSMYVLRRIFRLEAYLEPKQFRNLGYLVLSFSMLYLYFNVNEYLTTGYKFEGSEKALLESLFSGNYSTLFWTGQLVTVAIPMLLMMAVLGVKSLHRFLIPGVALASFLVIIGAWIKRYLIVVPTLASPFLLQGGAPQYQPTWVEWSISAAAVAVFLLLYSLFAKLFPIISIWETREAAAEEAAAEKQAADASASRRLGFNSSSTVVLIACLLLGFGAAGASAAPQAKQPKATTITVEWKVSEISQATPGPPQTPQPDPITGRIPVVAGIIEGPAPSGTNAEAARPEIIVTATLRDDAGNPIGYQAVGFAMPSSFGVVDYGARPTNEEGQAKLTLTDRRYGAYPIRVTFEGDDTYAAAKAEATVDFGPRPAPALPEGGVLITPYPTANIGLPFLFFYGLMWVVFAYAFGYLILWRMPNAKFEKGD